MNLFCLVIIIILYVYGVDCKFINNRHDGVKVNKESKKGVLGVSSDDLSFNDFEVKIKGNERMYKVTYYDGSQVLKQKFHQYYKNVAIYGASVLVEFDVDDTEHLDPYIDFGIYYEKKYLKNYIQNTETKLSEVELVGVISANLGLTDDKFEFLSEEWIYFPPTQYNIPYHSFIVDVTSIDFIGTPFMPHIPIDESIFSFRFIIDAKTGDIMDKIDTLFGADVGTNIGEGVPGMTGDLSGNPKLGYKQYSIHTNNTLTLRDEHGLVHVSDCDTNYGCQKPLVCRRGAVNDINDDYDCEAAENDVNEGKGLGVLAYVYALKTYECFKKYIGEYPVDFEIGVRVHFGKSYDNAFWNGKDITFGDGSFFYPLISMDVMAHELGHGYTSRHSDLIYMDESGAMNEAYSDLAGKACEKYAKGTYSWKLGEDIFKEVGQGLRYMNDPPLDGKSPGHYDDIYRGREDRGGVHWNSGIYNKAYYNMVELGIPIERVFKIASWANKLYWTASSSMAEGVEGMKSAANDLYGIGSKEYTAVGTAFERVGLGLGSSESSRSGFESELFNNYEVYNMTYLDYIYYILGGYWVYILAVLLVLNIVWLARMCYVNWKSDGKVKYNKVVSVSSDDDV